MNNSVIINQISYNLEDILQDCWHRLINGAISAKHPFHSPSIATIREDYPEIRTVILRKAIPSEKTLIFHTDYRSPKVKQIQKNKAISWLFYDAKARIQLRIKTLATIHHQDELSLHRWNESRLQSKKCYLVDPAPSTPTELPTDGLVHFEKFDLTEETAASGYENFAVVRNVITQIDWLFLKHDGHRRAQFKFEENDVKMNWVVP